MPQQQDHHHTPPPEPKKSGMGMMIGLLGSLAIVAVGAFIAFKKPTPPARVVAASTDEAAWVDMIPLLKSPLTVTGLPNRDSDGEWSLASGAVSVKGAGPHVAVSLPVDMPASYDLTLKMTTEGLGISHMGVLVPVAGRMIKVNTIQRHDGSTDGITTIVKVAKDTPNPEYFNIKPSFLQANEERLVEIAVREVGDQASLSVKADGQSVFEWSGPQDKLMDDGEHSPNSPRGKVALTASMSANATWREVRYRPVTGATAVPIAATPLPASTVPEPTMPVNPPAPIASLPATGWQSLPSDAVQADGWGKLTKSSFVPGYPPDIALRARLRFVPNSAGISAQSTNAAGSYRAQITPKGDAVMLHRDSPVAAERKLLAQAALSAPLTPGQEYVLAVASVGDTVSVHVDGRPLLSERLPKLPGSVVLWTRSPVDVRDIQWLSLSPAATPKPAMPATSADSISQLAGLDVAKNTISGEADLLALADVAKDAVGGIWRREGTDLLVEPNPAADPKVAVRFAFMLPVRVKGSYQMEVEFTKRGPAGTVTLLLPLAADRSVAAHLQEFSPFAGLVFVRGTTTRDADNPTRTPHQLENGRRYRAKALVRLNGDQADIAVTFEDKPLFQFQGPITDLDSRNFALEDHARPGMKSIDPVTWHRIRIKPLDGGILSPVRAGDAPGGAQTQADPYLAKLESGFQTRYQADAQKPFELAVAALNQSYVANGIARARAAAKAKGSLTEVTALDAEKAAIEKGAGVPVEDATDTPEALKTLRGTYRTALAKISADRDAKAAPLLGLYLQALDAHVAELTKAGKIDEATKVQTLRDEKAAKKPTITPVQTQAVALPTPTPAVSGDASYTAAKFLVSNGGSCVVVKDGVRVEVKTPDTIPAAPFEIHELYFDTYQGANKTVTSADFQALKGLHQLRRVNVRAPENKRLTDDAYAFLAGNEDLDFLNLEGVPAVTDAVLKHLAGAKKLRELGVQYAPGFTGEGLVPMPFLANLSRVDFLASGLDDKGIEALAACVQISSIRITQGKASDKAFAMLGQLPKLVDLRVDRTSFGDKAAAAIANAGILQYLDVSSTQIGNNGLGKLEALTSLTSLVISNTSVNDAAVARLQKAIPNCKVTR
jgi:hypothetical protein